jgi:two-component system response regulator MprA
MKRILIVDDDRDILSCLEMLLEDTYEVHVAEDGLAALQRIESKETFDLILLDLMMPRLDGAGLKRELDARRVTTPVILLSAGTCIAAVARSIGAAAYIRKPFDTRALEEKIAALTATPATQPPGPVPVPVPAPAPAPAKPQGARTQSSVSGIRIPPSMISKSVG